MRKQLVIGAAAISVLAIAAVMFVVATTSGPSGGTPTATAPSAPAAAPAPVSADATPGTEDDRPLTPEDQEIVRRMFAPPGAPPAAPAPAPAPAAPQWPVIAPTPEQRAHLDAEGERKRAQMRRAGRGEKPPRSAEDLE